MQFCARARRSGKQLQLIACNGPALHQKMHFSGALLKAT